MTDAERIQRIREFVSTSDTKTDRVFLLEQIDARDVTLRETKARYEQRLVEVEMRAHAWMRAHDMLQSWINERPGVVREFLDNNPNIPLPSPANLPNALREKDAEIEKLKEGCPFDRPNKLQPEDPCPLCGDRGDEISPAVVNCVSVTTPAARELREARDEIAQAIQRLTTVLKAADPQWEPLGRLPDLCAQIDNLIAGYRVEIERLRELTAAGKGHDEPCVDCARKCNSLAGNPGAWPVYLGDGWHHVACVRKRMCGATDEREKQFVIAR